ERDGRLAQVKSATATPQNLLHRAAEIDVDHVEARLDELLCPERKLLGLGAHELPADRMLFVRDVKNMPRLQAIFERDQKLVEHHLAERVRRAMPAREHAHARIAIAAERGLHDRKADVDVAEAEMRQPR